MLQIPSPIVLTELVRRLYLLELRVLLLEQPPFGPEIAQLLG